MGIVLGKLCHLVFDCKFILAISQLIERNKPLSQNKVRVQHRPTRFANMSGWVKITFYEEVK